jgi:two-component system, LytTR family, response regulator
LKKPEESKNHNNQLIVAVFDPDMYSTKLLKLFGRNTHVIDISLDYKSLFNLHSKTVIDLLLVNIDSSENICFEILEYFNNQHYHSKSILITAKKSINVAFLKYSVFDFYIQPFDFISTNRIVLRYLSETNSKNISNKLDFLCCLMQNNKIKIAVKNGYKYLDKDEILYFKAEGTYSKVFFENTEPLLICTNVGKIEASLQKHSFLRISNSLLVNKNKIIEFDRKNKECIICKNQDTISLTVSRRKIFLFNNFIE